MATLQSSAGLQTFWHDVGTMVRDGGHVDLLACDVAANAQGVAAVHDIDQLVDVSGKHIQVDASTDLTGNASSGGNWQLELGGVNAAPIYFNVAALSHWDGLLDSPTLTLRTTPTKSLMKIVGLNLSQALLLVMEEQESLTLSPTIITLSSLHNLRLMQTVTSHTPQQSMQMGLLMSLYKLKILTGTVIRKLSASQLTSSTKLLLSLCQIQVPLSLKTQVLTQRLCLQPMLRMGLAIPQVKR